MFWFFELSPIMLALLAIALHHAGSIRAAAAAGWASFAISQAGRLRSAMHRRRAELAATRRAD